MLNDTKKTKKTKGFVGILALGTVLFVGISAATYYFLKQKDQNNKDGVTTKTQVSPGVDTPTPEPTQTPTPTPNPSAIPFYELTIPYLRSREYQSSLNELEKISEHADYTSYLASYDSEGFRVYGHITIPKGNPPAGGGWPAVVFLHGYIPPQNYRTLVNYASYVDYLAKNGLVVFKIDLRGHGDSEGEAYGAYYSSDYVVDTLNAVAALKTSDFINPEKIGLWGHSMAGNVVFRAFAARLEVSKVVIWAGAVYTYEDFSQFSISDSSYQPPPEDSLRRRYREELGRTHGAFDPGSDFWKQVPATNYLDELAGEVQVHHTLDDNVVDINYSRNLMSILDNTQIGHELFEYPSGGHNITGSSFTQAMERSVDFFKR